MSKKYDGGRNAPSATDTHRPPPEGTVAVDDRDRRPRARFPRWYFVYFLLAAFDIATLSGSLMLHHQIVEIFRDSVSTEREWSAQFERYVELSLMIAAVNAPGNDIFDSGDVDVEQARLHETLTQFKTLMGEARQNLPTKPAKPKTLKLREYMGTVDFLVVEMTQVTNELFELYRNGQFHEAGVKMASMDRIYAKIIRYMTLLEADSHKILEVNMDNQVLLAEKMKFFEYLIAGLICVMVIGVAAYGYKLSRQIVAYTVLLENQYEALEGSEQRFRDLTEGSIQGTIVHGDDRPLFVNQAWADVHGYDTLQEAQAMTSVSMTVALEDRDLVRENHEHLLREGNERLRFEYRAVRKNGRKFWLESMSQPIRWNGRPAIQTTVIDIDERKRAEQALFKAKEETEKASAARTKFFAAASHDLRQPLYTMSLLFPLLSRDMDSPGTDKIVKVLQGARDTMEDLLDSILDISKLDAGIVHPQMVPMSIAALFDKLEAEFKPLAAAKGLSLRVIPASATIATDPALFERILRNLLSNAVNNTSKGRVLLGARRRGRTLDIEIWDTGRGIAADRITKIFQEFYQIGVPEQSQQMGLGLGLAIVDRLIRLLGHKIKVRSEPGKGSVFSVSVSPTREKAVDSPPSAAADEWNGALSGKLAVLIDDDEWVLRGSRIVLETWGCEVISAHCIEDIIKRIGVHNRRPDFILADLRLSNGETGLVAIERIRRHLGEPIPAIVVTGDIDTDRIPQLLNGGHTLVRKPIKPQDLLDKINTIIKLWL